MSLLVVLLTSSFFRTSCDWSFKILVSLNQIDQYWSLFLSQLSYFVSNRSDERFCKGFLQLLGRSLKPNSRREFAGNVRLTTHINACRF